MNLSISVANQWLEMQSYLTLNVSPLGNFAPGTSLYL